LLSRVKSVLTEEPTTMPTTKRRAAKRKHITRRRRRKERLEIYTVVRIGDVLLVLDGNRVLGAFNVSLLAMIAFEGGSR
jgi:hypothetical protein